MIFEALGVVILGFKCFFWASNNSSSGFEAEAIFARFRLVEDVAVEGFVTLVGTEAIAFASGFATVEGKGREEEELQSSTTTFALLTGS